MASVPIYIANDPDRLTDPTYHNTQTEGFYRDNEGRTRFLVPSISPSRKYHDRGFALLALLMIVAILVLLYLGASSGFFSKNPFSRSKRSQQPMTEKALIAQIRKVVESGGNIDASQNQYNQTLLHIVAKYGFVAAVNICLDNGADIEAYDHPAKMTPLHRALFSGNVQTAKVLINRGANIEARDAFGKPPLFSAIHPDMNRDELVGDLLVAGANVDARDNHGRTAIYWAIHHGHIDVAKIFLESGADITVVDILGMTPLHDAAYEGRDKIAELLIEHGADVNAQDKDGSTPLDIASGAVAKILRSHGAKRGSEL